MSTDRVLTVKEERAFRRQMRKAVISQEFHRLIEENQSLKLYIKVLEDLGVSRNDKMARLEKTLATLEHELLKLR